MLPTAAASLAAAPARARTKRMRAAATWQTRANDDCRLKRRPADRTPAIELDRIAERRTETMTTAGQLMQRAPRRLMIA
jgi:hypothetical protein